MSVKTPVGIVGCGNISSAYIELSKRFQDIEIQALADLDIARARAKWEKHGVGRICLVEELLADPGIEIVLNLTPPAAHAPIAIAALQAGKSIYNEKPLALRREDAREMQNLAQEKGLRIGCAPDTFMGAGLQTCRKLIDEGAIGKPVAATAFMLGHGPEAWHPDPEFFYQAGGGPMFDMGPYYITALVSLLGAVSTVTGMTRISFPTRAIGSGLKKGKEIKVEIPTHVVGVLGFASGLVATLIMSFDVWAHNLPRIEIYGSEGTLSVPDPNTFGGPVKLWRTSANEWVDVPLVPGYPENSRSLGLADMAHAIRSGRPHRANGKMAYHVLDVMHTIHDAAVQEKQIKMASACERPQPMRMDLPAGVLED